MPPSKFLHAEQIGKKLLSVRLTVNCEFRPKDIRWHCSVSFHLATSPKPFKTWSSSERKLATETLQKKLKGVGIEQTNSFVEGDVSISLFRDLSDAEIKGLPGNPKFN